MMYLKTKKQGGAGFQNLSKLSHLLAKFYSARPVLAHFQCEGYLEGDCTFFFFFFAAVLRES